ncbi:hypothetical protein CAXC1_280001 [Candidatus Xenohaliotis californiensis]|uniref:Uncharacterized protein n=1 Tax=Candidatus Xenohaliotis californiensis TaxID=84677 RepID=A0ABP0EU21_9RICK|nr:hypothetical protein CAXC1_280001 [Candidatus Xenohaliotis californiensis]
MEIVEIIQNVKISIQVVDVRSERAFLCAAVYLCCITYIA